MGAGFWFTPQMNPWAFIHWLWQSLHCAKQSLKKKLIVLLTPFRVYWLISVFGWCQSTLINICSCFFFSVSSYWLVQRKKNPILGKCVLILYTPHHVWTRWDCRLNCMEVQIPKQTAKNPWEMMFWNFNIEQMSLYSNGEDIKDFRVQ